MGSRERHEAERLRLKYSRVFDVPHDDVLLDLWPDDIWIYCPKRPGLPRWSLGGNLPRAVKLKTTVPKLALSGWAQEHPDIEGE